MPASTYNNNGFITRIAGSDLSAGQRVKFSANNGVVTATAANDAVGTVEQPVLSGSPVTVRLFNTPGTRFGIAGGAISANASVYAAANGKLASTATAGAVAVGIAISATSADGDVLDYLPTLLVG